MRDILPELNGKEYIQKLNQDYEIRFCEVDEVEQLIDFLRRNWKEDHIFVLNRELFDWQHLDTRNKRYNYVVAKHRITKEFHSVLGFIPTSQFDCNIEKVEIWPCIWKSREDIHVKGLGVSLYYYLKETLPIETIAILGISDIALSIYKHWNFKTGKVKQFYMLNRSLTQFNMVKEWQYGQEAIPNTNHKELRICSKEEFQNLNGKIVEVVDKYKSLNYYINRYLKHPTYQYQIYKIMDKEEIVFILFTRECYGNQSKCLRIVDFIGAVEMLIGCESYIQDLLVKNNYEYIDFINVGIDNEILHRAGFSDRDKDGIIIPNYFEPFILENINLDYAFKSVSGDASPMFVKADADQDRPNLLLKLVHGSLFDKNQ